MRRVRLASGFAIGCLVLTSLTGCDVEAPEPANYAVPPAQHPGIDFARAWCRHWVAQELGSPEGIRFQPAAPIRTLTPWRFEVRSTAVLEDGSRHHFRCVAQFKKGEGWIQESLDLVTRQRNDSVRTRITHLAADPISEAQRSGMSDALVHGYGASARNASPSR
jgi:hypothetical protein